MSTGASFPVVALPVEAVPRVPAERWRATLQERLAGGERLVTLYGRRVTRPDGEGAPGVVSGGAAASGAAPGTGAAGGPVEVTAVFAAPSGALAPLRATLDARVGYHALTSELPALHAFERELHEQTGLRVAGHPWLKPVRFEGGVQSDMDAYPYHRVDGKEVHEVAVGPIHAGVIEPGSFRFMCHGEQVLHLEIQLGYQHRGVERRLLEAPARALGPLVETVAGDTSVAHAWAYAAALEALDTAGGGGRPDPGAARTVELGRALMLELERVAMHLAGLTGLAADVGFLQGATTYGRLRTTAINTSMRLCGSRFGRGAVRPGGARLRVDADTLAAARAGVRLLRADLDIVNPHFLGSRTVEHRLRDVGVVPTALAREAGLVGFAARASGVPLDAREGATAGAYAEAPLPACVRPTGDCWARARLRIDELDASLGWLEAAVERLGESAPASASGASALAPVAGRADPRPLPPGHLALALVEGWRGECVHALETDADGRLAHYKVQDPSLRNWLGLALAVRHNEISDFPICNKSFDLSYCGHDL